MFTALFCVHLLCYDMFLLLSQIYIISKLAKGVYNVYLSIRTHIHTMFKAISIEISRKKHSNLNVSFLS